jgi:hypothetical protein
VSDGLRPNATSLALQENCSRCATAVHERSGTLTRTTSTAGGAVHTKTSKDRTTKIATIAAALVTTSALLTGCAGLNGAQNNAYAPVSAAPATTFQATRLSYMVNARVCADATGSTSTTMPQFGPNIRAFVATAVRGWARRATSDLTTGTNAQPGLSLQMRWVNTDPLADMNALNVSVPPVDALVAEPDVTSSTFVADDQAWQTAAAKIKADSRTGTEDTAKAAAKVKAFQWADGNSGISGCISALIEDLPEGHTALLVASDGEETEPPQVAGNLHDARVLWVMPCPSGNAKHCTDLQSSWKKLLTGLGAKSVKFVRPESANATLFADFLKGA